MKRRPSDLQPLLAATALVLLVAGLYGVTRTYPFYSGDDGITITGNPRLAAGLTWDGVRWAFSTFHFSSWYPLTWLWLLATRQLFGPGPAAFHLSNVLAHALAATALFALLLQATGARWRSALAAGLFAVHPLHVEAVAWPTEVSTPLAAAFGFLALLAHVRHARRPSPARLALSTALGACAVMAKQTWVVLPAGLLLLDFWPLGRWRRVRPAQLLLEKLPAAVVAAAAAALKIAASSGVKLVSGDEHRYAPAERLANALLCLPLYLRKLLWPSDLAVAYPHLGAAAGPARLAGAALFLGAVTALSLLWWKRRPWVAAGWCWFLAGLAPTLGVIQVGWVGMADRYAYLPAAGIAWAAVWGGAAAVRRGRVPAALSGAATAAAILALFAIGRQQLGYWRGDVANLQRAVAVSPADWLPRLLLGTQLLARGRIDEGVAQLELAVRHDPREVIALTLLGQVAADRGQDERALGYFEAAARAGSRHVETYFHFGNLLARRGQDAAARDAFRQAVALRPDHAEAYNGLGGALARLGDPAGALECFERARALRPGYAEAALNAGRTAAALGRTGLARERFTEVLRLEPGNAPARAALAALQGK